ncbi:MAG TPA: hypothetical protein VHE23_06510 [Candidatus Acidoferrales bacterium]|nr:hypothetical protein [Candidatus Acidoferrales bacterium]
MADHEASSGWAAGGPQECDRRSGEGAAAAKSGSARRLARTYGVKFAVISGVLLIPCYWQKHIEAGDLASHLYNAWLVQLIHQGRAPGLYLAPVWNNVLFDYLLSGLAGLFGFAAAEKLAVSLAVLVFFWGAFAFAWAASRQAPWFLLPCLAMLAYGWTFHSGFFNYYLSVGLSFWGLAIFLAVDGWKRYLALGLPPLIVLGHPMGLVWFLGAVAYIAAAERVRGRYQILLLLPIAAALAGLHHYLLSRFTVENLASPRYLYQGADQLMLSTDRHIYVAGAAFFFGAACFLWDAVRRRREPGYFRRAGVLLQLYGAGLLAVFLLPDAVFLPSYSAPVGLIVQRLTLIPAVVGCCLLGTMAPRRWHAAGFSVIAAAFFFLTYRETRVLNHMEEQAARLLENVPAETRVLETIVARPESRIYFIDHMVDRECIGHCFAYGNYEPASGQFRVRARPENPIVMAEAGDIGDMEEGTYKVPPEVLPIFQVYQCSKDFTRLCIRKLKAGEANGRLDVHPEEDDP